MKFKLSPKNISNIEFVRLLGEDWFSKQKIAGQAVAKCLNYSKELIESKIPNLSLKDLEAGCCKIIEDMACTPTFKGYKGFPGSICTSINKNMVHGIPSDYKLQDGDVVKIDLGATYEGAIADAATTVIYGQAINEQHKRLLTATKEALMCGIQAVKIGNQVGCIGNAIYRHSKKYEFSLITNYGGHCLWWNTAHAQCFIPNKASVNEGIRIRPGLTLAIEPMLVIGTNKTKTLDDGWTVEADGISAHEEHTIFVGEDKIHIMTELAK